MRTVRRFVSRLTASALRRPGDEQRMREEVEDHLALQTAENVRAGVPPVEARRLAVLKFGAVEAVKEHYRDQQRLPLLENLARDVGYALRQLRKSPLFSITATLSLAVGIGANAAIFTIVDRVLLRQLPVTNPEELVFVTDQRRLAEYSPRFSYPFYLALADSTALNGVAARFALALNAATSTGIGRVNGELISGTYFRVVGADTQIGRPLTPEDDRTPGAHAVAVISDRYWKRSFGSDPSVLGRSVRLNNRTFTVVGVAAADFTGTDVGSPTDIWIPMTMQREVGRDFLTDARTNWVEILGRVKPGTTLARAGAELTAYLDRRRQTAPPGARAIESRGLVLLPGGKGSSGVRRELGPALRVLQALTVLGLVMACANVASLLVVRSAAREKEIAVRLALGARRANLVRQFLTETLVLAALGATAGLLTAPWAAGLLMASQPGQLGVDPSVDMRVFLFGLAAWIVTGLVVGMAPILASNRIGLVQISGNYTGPARATRGRPTLRDLIVTTQIAVSLVMLIGAGLFVQSLRSLTSVNPGFRADDLLLISVDPGSAGYDGARLQGFWRDTLDRVSRIPGAQSVSLAKIVPLGFNRQRQPMVHPPSGEKIEIDTNFVGPAYFRTLAIPLLRGREFGERDDRTSGPVVIVNDRMARMFWPGEDPLGKAIPVGRDKPPAEIVGIVSDVKYRDLRSDAAPMLYIPVFQTGSSDAMTVHVRAASDPAALGGAIRRGIQTLDPKLPLSEVTTLEDQLNGSFAQTRQAAILTGAFGVLALLLSALGVYGVTALAASRHTHEIGIRMALGAQPHHIARVIGGRGLALVTAGLVLGLLGSFGFIQLAGALLYGVRADDGVTFAGMSALLALVSLTAIYIPARAAARFDAVRAINSR